MVLVALCFGFWQSESNRIGVGIESIIHSLHQSSVVIGSVDSFYIDRVGSVRFAVDYSSSIGVKTNRVPEEIRVELSPTRMNSTPNQPTTFNHTNTDTSTTRRDGRGAIPLSSYSLPTPMHPHTMPLPPMSPTNNYQLQPPASPTLAATYPAYTSPSLHSVMSSPPPVSPSFPLPLGVSLTPAALTGTNLCALASISVARLTQAELLFKAKIAMQAERYEEMAYFMKTIVQQQNMPLTTEERGLFAVAYKKLLAQRRMGWRYIYSIEMKEKAAARKLESELSREIEKDNAAKAKEADKSSSSDGDVTPAGAAAGGPPSTNTDETKTKTQTSTTLPQTSTTPANNTNSQPNPSASHIQSLQSRLATLTTNLQHVHSYRYQLFYESSLLISEVSSLLLDHLLPKLLTQHAQSEDVFTRSIPMIIEQVISWERKRSGRSKGAGVGVGSSAAQQPASSKDKSSSLSTNSSSSSSIAPSLESGLTPLLTAMPVPSTTPTPNAALNKLDNSRHWSLEVEFELQLRALDERTRFLSTLRASHAESLVFYLKMLGQASAAFGTYSSTRPSSSSSCVLIVPLLVFFSCLSVFVCLLCFR